SKSYESTVHGVLKLLEKSPNTLRSDLLNQGEGDAKVLRKLIWKFLRSSETGLPGARLASKSLWLPQLKNNLEVLLTEIEGSTSFKRSSTWASNVTKADLTDSALWSSDLINSAVAGIRVDTVHQVKGEGFPVVLYLARTADLNKLINGTGTEDGRIGYVAATRAGDLLIVAVPESADMNVVASLEKLGIQQWASSGHVTPPEGVGSQL
ncbi:MAG: 3'-5' exonuclease, partial [Stenotrophobium sp.]